MTNNEKIARYNELRKYIFLLDCKDRWDRNDWDLMDKMRKEKNQIRQELEADGVQIEEKPLF